MGDCFVSNVTSSCNYINAAHLDVDDCCEGIITWTIDGDDVDNRASACQSSDRPNAKLEPCTQHKMSALATCAYRSSTKH